MFKVLIAEDDCLIADLVEDILIEHGYNVCGIARTVAEAVVLGRQHKPDIAIVDLRLADGGLGNEIVTQLRKLGRLGVLYATGNFSQLMELHAEGDACLSKPYGSADLLRGLEIVADIISTGRALPPFPPGFHLMPSAHVASHG